MEVKTMQVRAVYVMHWAGANPTTFDFTTTTQAL
jgi:hypothetical protein